MESLVAGGAAGSRSRVRSTGGVSEVAAKANPLTYPKSMQPFSYELFQEPTAEYRGCPFWAWNTKLDRGQLQRQIDVFEAMGFGGFHMHSRVGLDTEYMGDEFMDLVKFCVDYAESKGMLACLYDEDKWPSGVAGGRLTEQNPEHLVKHLVLTPECRQEGPQRLTGPCVLGTVSRYLLARYSILLDESGCLQSAEILRSGETARDGGDVWYAYVETLDAWGNVYVDTLSEPAIARFIEMTHERYKAKVGDKFGTTVPCIFTDEPQFSRKIRLPDPWSKNDVLLPWTHDLPRSFEAAFGPQADVVRDLPQVVWDLPAGTPSLARWRYHEHVCERFVSAFMDQIAAWCADNNILLDGHMMLEDTLFVQTMAIGEAMRCYRNQQIPGMDLLFDTREFNAAKQVSSVARQKGARAAMSELYGVTHWTFTFEGHKGCGDWHAALGITLRVHHLAWVSMAGEGKRDYPASIGYQSPWCLEYRHIEDHFARVALALTRGRAVTRVAVIHPLESFWLALGPESPSDEGQWRDQAFRDLTDWLLHGLVDFDFISESLLPDQFGGADEQKLHVGECAYEVVILPNMRTIRRTTVDILQSFLKAGGKIIIAGQHPVLVDAQETERVPIIERTQTLKWDRDVILAALDHYRDLKVVSPDGNMAHDPDSLLYQMRQDGAERYVFICNTDRTTRRDGIIQLRGTWNVQILDTITGEHHVQEATRAGGWTNFSHRFEGCASLLLRLSPPQPAPGLLTEVPNTQFRREPMAKSQVLLDGVTYSEPNVLILDHAMYKINNEEWKGPQEILQIDDDIRCEFGMDQKINGIKQPWTIPLSKRQTVATVSLRFTFEVLDAIDSNVYLALELQNGTQIEVNGEYIEIDVNHRDWWVDEAISKIQLPGVRPGINTISLTLPFGILTNLERHYLLGDFSVNLQGARAVIQSTGMPSLDWGDITLLGLPFYAGNVTYCVTATVEMLSHAILSVPDFHNPVLALDQLTNGTWKRLGRIAFQPRQLDLGVLEAGRYTYRITAFGNRYNAFGHVHLPDDIGGCSPELWRTKNSTWSENYLVRPIGVLTAPTLLTTVVEKSLLGLNLGEPIEPICTRDSSQSKRNSFGSTLSTPESPSWVIVAHGNTDGVD
ncbi:family 2 glycoside hydrolase [Xylariales sp. PMI_506]|nr:family 2 glycoside hydrolase [Xylariales sp. PMI_506]